MIRTEATRSLHKAALDWLTFRAPVASIAASLTFDPNRSAAWRNRHHAHSAFRRFSAMLNREVYGNASWRYNKRLSIVPMLEGGGQTGKHLHYHAVIEVPAHLKSASMKEVVIQVWRQQPEASLHQNIITDRYSDGFIRYMLKVKDKDDVLEALDVGNLWLN